jgi:hypothetical protein
MSLWKALCLGISFLLSLCATGAIHPLSLLSSTSEEKISPLSEIKFDQLVRPDQRLSNLEMRKMDSQTWESYLMLTQNYFPLPTKEHLGPVSKTLTLPPTLLETGRRFREMRRIVNLRPEFLLEAYEFFSQCTENKEILETVNTICLGHAWSLARDHQLPFEKERFPKHWLELASLTFAP